MPAASKILEPPQYISRLPKTVVRRLEPEALLHDALAFRSAPSPGTLIALHGLNDALAAAERQQRRIARARRALEQGGSPSRLGGLFYDVHFYVVCWARAAKLARYLSAKTGFPRLKRVLKSHRTRLDAMVDARDHVEHLEERLGPGPRRDAMKERHDLFNLLGDAMSFGGVRYDVGLKSLQLLRSIVRAVREAIVYDAMDVLAQNDRDLLVRRIRQAHGSVMLDRQLRQIREAVEDSGRGRSKRR